MMPNRLFPRFAIPILAVAVVGALAAYYASSKMANDLRDAAFYSRAYYVVAALNENVDRYSSAYELMTYLEQLGGAAVELKHIALVDDERKTVVAATDDAWLSRPIDQIRTINADYEKGSWSGHNLGEVGFAFPVVIDNPAIESVHGKQLKAVIVIDSRSLVTYTEGFKWVVMSIFLATGVGFSIVFLYLLRRRILMPVHQIHHALEARPDVYAPLKLPDMNQDEIGQLGKYLNTSMQELSEVSQDLLVMTRAIEGSSSELYVIDADRLIVTKCNRAACDNLRTTEENVVGSHIFKFAPQLRDTELFEKLTESLVRDGENSYTYTHLRADGTTYPFEFRSMLVLGRSSQLVVIGNDVSERILQEEAIQSSERRMQLALNGSNDGMFDIDIDQKQVFLSERLREWLLVSEPKINIDGLYSKVGVDHLEEVKTAFNKAMLNDGDLNIEFQLPQEKTGGRWLQARGQVQISGDNDSKHLSGFMSDITSRKVAEKMVYASVSRLGAVLDHIADGIVTLTREGRVCTVNPAVLEMLGRTKADISDSHFDNIVRLIDANEAVDSESHPHDLSDVQVNAAWTNGNIDWQQICDGQVRETLALRDDGSVFASEISVTSMEGVGEERYTVVLRNIAQRKQHEIALRKAMESAQAATRAKGDFLATMSHEIRTPMNGVLGMTQLLLDMDLTAAQKETAMTIFSSGESLLSLINDILDFSKIEAGKLELERIPFDLRNSIKEVLDLTATNARLKSLDLYVDYPADCATHFNGDVGRIRQVLLNLVGNAIKFTATGHVLVKVEQGEAFDGGYTIRVSVHDSGPGVARDVQAKLFDAFTQEDTSTTRRFGGTGLGLAICKQLVELMGGEIGLRSEPAQGSEFYFNLPMITAQIPDENQIENDDRLAGKKMLVVDDNPIGVHIGCEIGKSFGMQVSECMEPLKVLDMLETALKEGAPYDLLALDYHMPDLDGLTLATNIRGDDRFSDLKIVMLTSSDIKRPPGLDGYTLKPLMRNGLRQLLLDALFGVQNDAGLEDTNEHKIEQVTSGLRVLLAEDNPVNQRVAVRMLEKLGCRVDVAANGREAVEMWQRFSYSMVFMDCQMPELDGLAATRQIRQLELENEVAPTPIVAMTANAMTQDEQDCLEAGMDDYASKPVKIGLLQSMVAKWSQAHTGKQSGPLH